MANPSPKSPKAKAQPVAPAPSGNQTQAQREAIKQQMDAARQSTRVQVQARRDAQRAAVERARRTRAIIIGSVLAVLIIGSGIGLLAYNNYSNPGTAVPEMSDRHHLKDLTEAHVDYSTNPPTSGPHVGDLKPWGVYTDTVPNELLVHNLEDAGVIVNYSPDLPQADFARLKALVDSYESKEVTVTHKGKAIKTAGGGYVIMVPYKGMKAPIVLTAWNRMQEFATYDEEGLRHFIDMYRGIDHHED